jgi:hypothetical protein
MMERPAIFNDLLLAYLERTIGKVALESSSVENP